MKKTLKIGCSLLVAGVMAASVAAFSACGDDNGDGSGGASVLTEAEWKSAIQATLSAQNYVLTANRDLYGETNDEYGDQGVVISKDGNEIEYKASGYNSVSSSSGEHWYEKYENTHYYCYDSTEQTITHLYEPVWPTDKYDYEIGGPSSLDNWGYDEKYADLDWVEWIGNIYSLCGLTLLGKFELAGTGDQSDVKGTMENLYGLFAYDKADDSYKAELQITGTPYELGFGYSQDIEITVSGNISIGFSEGKVSKVVYHGSYNNETYGVYHLDVTAELSYGTASFTWPTRINY